MMGVITNLLARPELPADHGYPSPLVALMESCWQFEARARPSFAAVLDTIERVAADEGRPFPGALSPGG